jgi:prefoldin subunit 5
MTQETRNAIKALKEVILSSNPNPRYGDMIRALNELEATLPEEEVIVAKLEEVKEEIIHEMQELGATEEQINDVVEDVQEVIEEVKTPKKKSSKKTTDTPTA